jgi:NAD(P)-dependent dehydrogenase (short-subunit alcohol dehydrogenase family)
MLVTGGGRGIGAATALLAATRGYAVAVNHATSQRRAEALVESITAAGGTAMAVRADVGDDDDVVAMFATVDRELGPLTVLVNNAGTATQHGDFVDVDPALVRRVFEVNVVGSILCAREAVRRMSTDRGGDGGVIVNVSSRAARLGGSGEWIDYAATKGAIDTLTVGLAREVARQGIRVVGVRPGLMDNEFNDLAPPGRLARLVDQVPMGRPGENDEVARTILWLASDEASYITGATLDVSGGR